MYQDLIEIQSVQKVEESGRKVGKNEKIAKYENNSFSYQQKVAYRKVKTHCLTNCIERVMKVFIVRLKVRLHTKWELKMLMKHRLYNFSIQIILSYTRSRDYRKVVSTTSHAICSSNM